jgi:hypothetical protein
MTNKKKKEKRTIPLRDAGKVIISLERPSKVLYDLAAKAEKESLAPTGTSYHPLPPPTNKTDISPKRDYTKVANSIARDAVPSGLFKGTSKATYDVLYLKTRGAINPTRIIKAVQSDVLMWSNVSHNTLRAHLKHLRSVGLIKVHYKLGDNNGAEYEIFLPEEIDLPSYHLLPPPTTSQNVVGGTYQNLVEGGGGVMPENIDRNDTLKTSFKDIENNDDEPFGKMIETLSKVFENVSGKRPQKKDAEKLNEFAELIAMELEIAAARTKSISNVPAFLTEHLRRRLLGKAAVAEGKGKAVKSTKAGKSQETIEKYEAEPLSEEGREAVLKTMQEYIGKGQQEFVMSQQESYTKEDWEWLMHELK